MTSDVGLLANIALAFREGGIWMWLIFIAQVASLAIIFERIYALYLRRSPTQRLFVSQFEEDIKKGQLDMVLARASRTVHENPVSRVAEAGAQAALAMGGREEIQLRMEEVLLEETSKVDRRTGFLSMLGNVGTLLGLLGTVVGMIQSFSAVTSADPVAKAQILSRGISMAMYATAYGLIMAVPALVMYAVLQNRANVLKEDLTKAALKLFIWLGFSFESIPTVVPKKARTT